MRAPKGVMMRAYPLKFNFRRQALPMGLSGVVLISTIYLSKLISTGAYNRLALMGLGIAVAGIALTILGNWRLGFYLFLVWLTFEDLPRKFLGNNMAIFFGKDVLVGIAYFSFLFWLQRSREHLFRPPFLIPLLVFIWYGIGQVFNPLSPSILYGIAGLKVYFYYIPLMFLGYALITSEKALQRFLIFNLSIGAVVAVLGIVQAIVGLDFLNPAQAPEQLRLKLIRQAPLSHLPVPRTTSVFVSDGRFANYLLIMFILGLGGSGYFWLRGHYRMKVLFLSLGLITTAIVLTGVRTIVVFSLISLLIFTGAFLWGTGLGRLEGKKVLQAVQRGVLISGITLLSVLLLYPQSVDSYWSFYYETLAPGSPTSELFVRTWDYPVRNFLASFSIPNWPIVGQGIGTISLSAQYVLAFFDVPPYSGLVESGFGTVVVEMGILGLLLWLWWTVALMRNAWQVCKAVRFSPLFPLAFGIFWFVFYLLFAKMWLGMQAYQNYINNAYLWLLIGVLFRLPLLRAHKAEKI